MSNGSPALEVGFDIVTRDSMSEVEQLKRAFNEAEGAIVTGAANIERSTANVVKLGSSVVEFRALGTEATRSTASIKREAEQMTFAVNRSLAEFGQTGAALRNLRAERKALAAEDAGLSGVAADLRAANAALGEREQALRSASQSHEMFEAKVREGARAMREEEAAAERDATTLANLRAMIDPAAAAQARLNAELAEARRVMTAAGASAQELTAAEDALWARSQRAIGGHDQMAAAAGKNSSALRNVALQLPDITQGLLTGQPPMTVFIQQGFQIVQVAQMAEGGLRGFGKELLGLGVRFAPVLVALAAAGAGFALFNRWVNEGVTNDQLTRDLGKITGGADATKQELFKLKDATITWADTSSALFSIVGQDIAESFVGDMKGMGKDVKSVLDDLTSYGRVALAGLYAATVGMKEYIGQISSPKGLMSALTMDPKLFESTIEASFKRSMAYTAKLGDRVRSKALENARERNAATIGYNPEPKPKVDRTAERLAREAEATEAQIRNLYKLAEAYSVSGAASLIAEARVKAETDAIKKRGDIEAFVDRQVRLSIAERVKASAESAASMRQQAEAQAEVNTMVATGLIPAAQADEIMRKRLAELPLLQAIEAAQQRGLTKEAQRATAALKVQSDAQKSADAAEIGKRFALAGREADDRLADLRTEAALIGATNIERVRVLATIRATREAEAMDGTKGAPFLDDYVAKQVAIAVGTEQNAQATRDWNDGLRATADLWDVIASTAGNAAGGMADAFGAVGRSIGDAATVMTGYYADQARLQTDFVARTHDMADGSAALAREQRIFAIRSASLQIGAYGDMTSAAKGFFKEGTTGYKALAGAEKVFRAVELGMAIKNTAVQLGLIGGIATARTVATGTAVATDTAYTATSVTNAGVRASADAVAAMAKTAASSPFPFNLAGMAVMAAALASIGIATGFLGGGGGKNTLAKANDGTGTVLGNPDAKSESLKRSIDALRDIDTLMLSSSREMAATLRSINGQIGGVAALIVRAGDVNASGGVAEGFKKDAIGSVLSKIPVIGGILGGLFGTKTKVVGSGLSAGPQTLDSILNGGFDASYYSDVQKKKKLFGLTTSTKYSTQYSGADAGLENQFTLILREFASAIGTAAGPLGESTAEIERRLGGFIVDLGKIDLQGLSGEEIEEKLSAVFGAAADKMALAAFPGFERFQKVGEGAFETLVRVSSTVEAVTASLDMLGGAARNLGIDAKLGLAGQFDSVGDFNSAAQAYFETYYSAAEQNVAKVSQLSGVFVRLGATMPTTLDGFRALVEAQDLATAAGQSTYATLLQLAPAFADLNSSMGAAKSAADILAEQQDLQRKILELNGDTAAIRALDLAKVDVSNRALQQQVWAIQDAQAAAQEAERLSEAWSNVGLSIEAEVNRIRGLSGATGEGGFASAMRQFNAATMAARGGDQDAAKLLPSLSQALLKSAGDAATSRQELDRVQAQTAASLEATSAVIAALAKGNPLIGVGTIAAAASAAQAAAPAASASSDAAAATLQMVRDEIAAMRVDNNAGHAATADNTGKIVRKLDDVTPNGDAIAVDLAA